MNCKWNETSLTYTFDFVADQVAIFTQALEATWEVVTVLVASGCKFRIRALIDVCPDTTSHRSTYQQPVQSLQIANVCAWNLLNPKWCITTHHPHSAAPSSLLCTRMWKRPGRRHRIRYPPCSMEMVCTGLWSLPHNRHTIRGTRFW